MKNDTITMFFYYTKMTIKSWFQYRVDAILRSFAVFCREATTIIIIYFTLLKFDASQRSSWNINEFMFLYSLLFITYGILIVFFTGLRDFSRIIRDGQFDRIMLRPRGMLFQIIAIDSDWFAALGHGCLGIVLFVYTANKVGIEWNAVTITYYIFSIFGGVLIQGALFLFFASLCFYFVKVDNVNRMFYWTFRRFAGFPISIYHKVIQYLMMFVIPFAFVNYFPVQYLLRNEDINLYPKAYLYITPFLGILMYVMAYGFWRFSIKYYKSTGN